MVSSPRYAIYYAPAHASALDRFGALLLGYDAFSGDDLPFPDEAIGIAPDWRELTRDPRAYGFHATLKAPFALAADKTEHDLQTAVTAFAKTPRAIPDIRPTVSAVGGFIAVVPAVACDALDILAQDCVTGFDAFRAPLTAHDRARRRPEALTARQVEQLDRWGYPYVFEDFQFHMTLTGRLPAERQPPILSMLRRRFATLALTTLAIDAIALYRQDDAGSRFRVIGRELLTPA